MAVAYFLFTVLVWMDLLAELSMVFFDDVVTIDRFEVLLSSGCLLLSLGTIESFLGGINVVLAASGFVGLRAKLVGRARAKLVGLARRLGAC